MSTNLEVHFCDLCNQSVPHTDIESGKAVRLKGRVIGGCCTAELPRSNLRTSERKSGGAAAALVGVVVLAGVAAGVAFLDWRLSSDVGDVSDRLSAVEEQLRSGQQRVGMLEEAVTQIGARISLDAVTARLDAVEGRLDQAQVSADLRASRSEEAQQVAVESYRKLLAEHGAALATLQETLQAMSADVASMRAAPSAPAKASESARDSGAPVPAAAPPESDLPPELRHQVLALTDDDPGTRFAAVDKLLRSNDPRVLPALLPMAKDTNPFVRRLTVEGLRTFRRPESVDVLVVALADAEPIVRSNASSSLRALTGQRFEFDDTNATTRLASQRRWQDWWDKNRATFSF